MIHFVTTASHAYTVRHLARALGRRVARVWHYEHLFRRWSVPSGTWIFTDHERLSPFELALAARVASALESFGATVLNHPARVRSRHAMLRAWHDAGINSFTAWRCEENPQPASFPVFIRSSFDHRGPNGGLIADQAELDARLAAMQREGVPLIGQLVVEYAGEQVTEGFWARHASYRIGSAVFAHHRAIDTNWIVKDGIGIERSSMAGWDAFVASERDFVSGNQHANVLRRAFDLAGIDYGRADFAIVGGRPEIYEINTNPNHQRREELLREVHPDRRDLQLASEQRVHDALIGLDRPAQARVRLDDPMLKRQQFFRGGWPCILRRA